MLVFWGGVANATIRNWLCQRSDGGACLCRRRQLRTLMCFTTEEKLSRGGSGDKRRGKSGSLSQRLRLSESSEEPGAGCSRLETLSGLVVRPSTCPPPELADQPSSFTLSSLNEEQLNSYLSLLLSRGAADRRPPAAAPETGPAVTEAVIESDERLAESAPSAADDTTPAETQCPPAPRETRKSLRRPTRRECEELIRRHEQLFGPIATSRPAPIRGGLPEPCQPPPPAEPVYLSIPRHEEAVPADPEWDAWRPHFTDAPDGVWRIVGSDAAAAECPSAAEAAAEEAPTRRRRLLGSLRHRCTALFRPQQKRRAPIPTLPAGHTPIELDTNAGAGEEGAEAIKERILSETKAEALLKDMNDSELAPCTSCESPRPPCELPRPDPIAYRGGAFRAWGGFFGQEASPPEDQTAQRGAIDSGQ